MVQERCLHLITSEINRQIIMLIRIVMDTAQLETLFGECVHNISILYTYSSLDSAPTNPQKPYLLYRVTYKTKLWAVKLSKVHLSSLERECSHFEEVLSMQTLHKTQIHRRALLQTMLASTLGELTAFTSETLASMTKCASRDIGGRQGQKRVTDCLR